MHKTSWTAAKLPPPGLFWEQWGRSSAGIHISHFNGSTSLGTNRGSVATYPPTSLAADYFEITDTNLLTGVKCITKNRDCILAAGLVHCTMAILIRQIQVMLSRKCWGTLAKASWLMTACSSTAPLLSQSCSPEFSTNIALIFLGNGTHEINKAFWNSLARSHLLHYLQIGQI